jgi:ATP-dependent Clp protease ATP-binding subunit ClpA
MTSSLNPFLLVGLLVSIGGALFAANRASPYLTMVVLIVALAGCVWVTLRERRRASGKPDTKVDHSRLAAIDLAPYGDWIKHNLRGHDDVIDNVVQAISQELPLTHAGKVIGAFLLVGPTGTGKTFLSQLVAQALYPRSEPVLLNMNQLKHADDVFTLIGPPPGRSGFEMGGMLTRPVLDNPYRVVIFDELDKCHPDLLDCLYDILDTGRCREKSSGKIVDFSGCVFFGTCNAGVEQVRAALAVSNDPDMRANKLRDALAGASRFERAFLARWTRIELMDTLAPLQVAEVALLQLSRYWQDLGVEISYVAPALLLDAVEKNEEFKAYGVRQLSTYIRRKTTPAISQARQAKATSVHLDVSPTGELLVRPANASEIQR